MKNKKVLYAFPLYLLTVFLTGSVLSGCNNKEDARNIVYEDMKTAYE